MIELHVSDVDGMAWASIDDGQLNDSVWLDRSWDGGSTWDGLLGKATIPSDLDRYPNPDVQHLRPLATTVAAWSAPAATRTASSAPTGCTWPSAPRAATAPTPPPRSGDTKPVPDTTLDGRDIALHVDSGGMAWATITGGATGDEVWLDRSWDAGASWPDGSSDGRVSVPSGATGTSTVEINTDDTARAAVRRRGARLRPGRRPARTAAAPRGRAPTRARRAPPPTR